MTPGEPLTPQDVAVDNRDCPTLVRIHLRSTQQDLSILARGGHVPRTDEQRSVSSGPLLAFMAVRRAGQGPLFVYVDGTPLTRDRLVETVQHILRRSILRTQLPDQRCHNGSAGRSAGLSDEDAGAMGVDRYVRTPRETLAAISAHLVS